MSCDVRSCDELSSVVPCNGIEWYELKTPLGVRSCSVVRSGSVTMWGSKELFCTTKYYSSTTLYYKVQLQYYKVVLQYDSVLQSTTPALLCSTKQTTLYYRDQLQYYSYYQNTTPVLLCTKKYYSSTTLYYKVLLQNYKPQSTTAVLL